MSILSDRERYDIERKWAAGERVFDCETMKLKAQDLHTAKEVNADWVKWGEGPCPHGALDFPNDRGPVTMCFRIACDQCWQERKKEFGL